MKIYHILVLFLLIACGKSKTSEKQQNEEAEKSSSFVTSPLEKLATDFKFTEGPAVDAEGNVYFSDIPNSKIWVWTTADSLKLFRENSNGANGLYFDNKENLLACEGYASQISLTTPEGEYQIIASTYKDKPFNSTNDLWPDENGGVYFTDPQYGGDMDNLNQGGMHVYYLHPNHASISRVCDDLVRPNGLIGTPDGKILYVSDRGAGKTYRYTIDENGTLSDKSLFVAEGSDGMTIDHQGRIYITTKDKSQVDVFSKTGEIVTTIEIPEVPTNVCFGGKNRDQLFITAQTSLYRIGLDAKGVD